MKTPTPSTPLPWSRTDGHFQHVSDQDIDYFIHAANAYPKLIAALISARNATDDTDEHAAIDELLGGLGHINEERVEKKDVEHHARSHRPTGRTSDTWPK